MEPTRLQQNKTIAILPLGAHEYHGCHLPAETDAIIANAFAQRLATQVVEHHKILALPVEKVGYSIEHAERSVTQTLSFDEAIKRWIAIGADCYQKGIRKLLLLNAHGGNSPLMNIVITELRCRYPMLAVATSWGRFGLPEGLLSKEEKQFDIHAGFIETSLMLYLAQEKVNVEKAENFSNKQEEFINKYKYLRAYGPFAFGWKMRDLNPKGAAGNAAKANAKAGELIFNHTMQGLTGLLADMACFNLDQFEE